jgi:glycosyltransferase involved in cell wall biosynthesis
MPEIFGDAAVFYPNRDGNTLGDVIRSALTLDKHQIKYMSKLSIQQSAKYKWDVCATETLAEFVIAYDSMTKRTDRSKVHNSALGHNNKTRVAIVNLTGGGLSGGYRNYLKHIIPLFCESKALTDIYLFSPFMEGIEAAPSWTVGLPKVDAILGFPWLKARIRRISPDVVFIPTSRWLDCGQIPVVVMVRNMEPLTIPFRDNPLYEAIRNLIRFYLTKRACQRATRVIAVSQHVRDYLSRNWHIESAKIAVVYHGVMPVSIPGSLPAPAPCQNLGRGEFLLTAGSIRPARGIEDVIHAVRYLTMNGFHNKLVIVGEVSDIMKKYKSNLEQLVHRLGLTTQIIWTGLLSPQELSWCYSNCKAFIMSSHTEACPNIALEAMSHGCICISNDAPPMPEIFTNVAVYYPSHNVEALCEAIRRVLSWDRRIRDRLSDLARTRAAEFSWGKCFEKTQAELAIAKASRKGY